ncbi:MAG: tripartite tricarboxylate transporter permease [Hyphomicrobiaceae bacterium]|nr:tripartite tricarboxylate transporter permease [Hyphomicrobiaceae bacterium]
MDLVAGLANVLTPMNLLFCFAGCFLGTLVGVLPGLGPASTLAILLPITMHLDPLGSIIMLAGLTYGAAYGGSTTSILVNMPGELGSVPTCFDGFPMTKQGRAGEALWIAAVGSFIAGMFGTLMLSLIGPGIASYALRFGPPEYFGLLLFSMTALVSLSGASLSKGLTTGLAGILLACVGIDVVTGVPRFNYGTTVLMNGFEYIPVIIGLFGIAEVAQNAEQGLARVYEGTIGKMRPRGAELVKGLKAVVRGTLFGFPLGLLPGMTPGVVSFLSYDLEKRISKHPEQFGKGAIEGVANVEAANNATAQAGFLPLLCFGIPTGPAPAIILAALMIYGLQPGPVLFSVNKEFAWTVIASMCVGNVMLLILNLPLVGLWARISTVPYKYLGPVVLALCLVGAYSIRNTMFDVWVSLGFGVLGYLMRKRNWPMAPLVLGFILGPMLEQALRQSLSSGGLTFFADRPIVLGLFAMSVITLYTSLRVIRRVPKAVLTDDDA